ncbi:MAG: PD-(D/E)XK nuclease domain-containing protein, partial [Thermodesulfovibrionales bacterium]
GHGVFIFEFKVIGLDDEPGSALRQIKDKGYVDKYKALNLPIYLVGIEFDKAKRNIKGFQWETLS